MTKQTVNTPVVDTTNSLAIAADAAGKTNTERAVVGIVSPDLTIPRDAYKKIVVIQAGWVVIGYTRRHDDGNLHIYEGSVVRSWGTNKGLGQIALEGPQTDTVLDPCGFTEVPFHGVLMQIRCVV
jgi:hypothetical protein